MFANLGFDTFTSEEYMDEQDEVNPNDWMKDKVLTRHILDCLNSTEGPDYVYTISVQGHGDYPEEPMIDNPEITVTGGESEAVNNKWEYYANQIHEMDEFVQELIDALSQLDEDVVLVMYGDHLPTMGLTVKDVKNRYLFQTEYVMWDNMGLKKKDENLSAYQMAAEVMNRVGIHEGNIFRYHQARRKTKNYQVDLEMIQYDILYGKQYVYDGQSPFERTKIHLGIHDATISSIEPVSANSYYVTGTNFTQSAFVEINGELVETTFIDPRTLLLKDVELKDGDEVDVAIRSNSPTKKVLTRTEPIIYRIPVADVSPGDLTGQPPETLPEEGLTDGMTDTGQEEPQNLVPPAE